MTALLDFYRMRFGEAVKKQGNGYNGPCPLCGGEPGKSDRFIIWEDRSDNIGKVCAEHRIAGVFSCRQCGQHGDTVAYLMKIEGMSFREALAELGIEAQQNKRRLRAPKEPPRVQTWIPKAHPLPSDTWMAYATKLVDEAQERIFHEPAALKWLAKRGIDDAAIRAYGIGYLQGEGRYPGRYRSRSALGLEPKKGADGQTKTKLFIPRGIVIPSFSPDQRVLNIRIRRPKPDLTTTRSPKYMELEGSSRAPLFLPSSRPAQLSACFVTEAELDAILIHHTSHGQVGAMAVRTNRGKPDAPTHQVLEQAALLCLALDYDTAGAEGLDFWLTTYPSATEWPTPEGKDPGEAFALGVDIAEWIAAALPSSMPQPSGQVDAISSGLITNETHNEDTLLDEHFTKEECAILRKAIPPYLLVKSIPIPVYRAYLLWCGVPIKFVKNTSGFGWEIDYQWRAKCPENQEKFEKFFAYQNTCTELWEWLSEHFSTSITASNLFDCLG